MSYDIPPEIELFIQKKHEADKQEYRSIFAGKWVEKAFIWGMYLVGGIVLTAIVLSAAEYIK